MPVHCARGIRTKMEQESCRWPQLAPMCVFLTYWFIRIHGYQMLECENICIQLKIICHLLFHLHWLWATWHIGKRQKIESLSANLLLSPWYPQVSALHPSCEYSRPEYVCVYVLAIQSCLTLCDPMVCTLPDSSVHGILQVRILGWVAMPFPRGSSQPWVFHIAGRFFPIWASREAPGPERGLQTFKILYYVNF